MTSEQLEVSRSERMRLNGHGTATFEDARTWIEETGFCLYLPRKQFAASVAPSFVEAVAGERNQTPDQKQIALAESLLVRLELEGVAVRLNLQGQLGEQPDYVVAAWVLPYVYALRGDRDWRRCPQLTGSRQVSPLAVQAYKLLESEETTVIKLAHALGREVTESAVMRAIIELWQQLRIVPVISAPGQAASWQLLRVRFQKAIAEGASTSQVTAISVLASIYLQAVIAATMEEVELFLAPLTARSKVREVLRGLVATRQVHSLSLSHSPHYYVAGTLPEFNEQVSLYSSSIQTSTFFHGFDREEEHPPAPVIQQPVRAESVFQNPFTAAMHAPLAPKAAVPVSVPAAAVPTEPAVAVAEAEPTPVSVAIAAAIAATLAEDPEEPEAMIAAPVASEPPTAESPAPTAVAERPQVEAVKSAARPHFSRPSTGARKPASAGGSRPVRHAAPGAAKPASSRHASASATGSRPARPASGAAKPGGARKTENAPSWSRGASGKPLGKSAPAGRGKDLRGGSGHKPSLAGAGKSATGARKSFSGNAGAKQGAKKRG